jgi:hypothetical protein
METAGGATPVPHPAVAPLAFLLGKWRGEGEGSFPTISPFRYGEELLFSHHPSKVHPRCITCGEKPSLWLLKALIGAFSCLSGLVLGAPT